jgi:hypothetical protein
MVWPFTIDEIPRQSLGVCQFTQYISLLVEMRENRMKKRSPDRGVYIAAFYLGVVDIFTGGNNGNNNESHSVNILLII